MFHSSHTTLKELKKRYLNILKKCLLANLMAFSFALPSMAEPTTETYIGQTTDPNMKMFSGKNLTRQFFSTEEYKLPTWKTKDGASRLGVFGTKETPIYIGRSNHNIFALYDDYDASVLKDLEVQAEFVEMAKIQGIEGDSKDVNINDLYITVKNSHLGVNSWYSIVGIGNEWAKKRNIQANNVFIDVKDTTFDSGILVLKTQLIQQANIGDIYLNVDNTTSVPIIVWDAMYSSTESTVSSSVNSMNVNLSNIGLLDGLYGIRQFFYSFETGSFNISIGDISFKLTNVEKIQSRSGNDINYRDANEEEAVSAYSIYSRDHSNKVADYIQGGKIDIALSNIKEITAYLSAVSLLSEYENTIYFTNKNKESGVYLPIHFSLHNVNLSGDLIALRLEGENSKANVGDITVDISGNTVFEKDLLSKSGSGILEHKGFFQVNVKNGFVTTKGLIKGWDNLNVEKNGILINEGEILTEKIEIDAGKLINKGNVSEDTLIVIKNGGVFENTIIDTQINETNLFNLGKLLPDNNGITLKKLVSNKGVIDLTNTTSESAIQIASLEGEGTTFKVAGEDVAKTTIGNNKSKKLTVSATGEFNDQVNDANKLATSLASVLTIQEGEKDLTLAAEEGKIARPMTAEVKDGLVQNVRVSGNGVTESVKDVMGLQVLSFRNQINDVQKRMGDLRLDENTKGTWVRAFGGDVKFGDMGLKNKYNTIQAGADFKKGNAYFGVMASLTEGDSKMNRGTGEDKTYGMGVYAGYMTNNGWYVDATAKQMHLQNKFKAKYTTGEVSRGSYKTWGTSVSLEAGKRMQLPCGFFVEPQAEVMYGRVQGIDYTTSAGVKVEQEAFESLIGRAGLSAGKTFKDKGSVYANVSVLNDFAGKTKTSFTYWNQETKTRDDMGGAWTEFAVGGTYKLNKNTAVYGEFATSKGTDLTNPIQWSVGLRLSF